MRASESEYEKKKPDYRQARWFKEALRCMAIVDEIGGVAPRSKSKIYVRAREVWKNTIRRLLVEDLRPSRTTLTARQAERLCHTMACLFQGRGQRRLPPQRRPGNSTTMPVGICSRETPRRLKWLKELKDEIAQARVNMEVKADGA